MTTVLWLQLLSPYMNIEEVLRLMTICKTWHTELTLMYPKLHQLKFFKNPNPKLTLGKNYEFCLRELKTGKYRLYPGGRWWIYIEKCDIKLPIPVPKLMQLISNKYKSDIWERYWSLHQASHRESGKSKCIQTEIPEIKLLIFAIADGKIRMRVILTATGKRCRCYQGCGNIFVLI